MVSDAVEYLTLLEIITQMNNELDSFKRKLGTIENELASLYKKELRTAKDEYDEMTRLGLNVVSADEIKQTKLEDDIAPKAEKNTEPKYVAYKDEKIKNKIENKIPDDAKIMLNGDKEIVALSDVKERLLWVEETIRGLISRTNMNTDSISTLNKTVSNLFKKMDELKDTMKTFSDHIDFNEASINLLKEKNAELNKKIDRLSDEISEIQDQITD